MVKIKNDETEVHYKDEYEKHLDPLCKFSLQKNEVNLNKQL